MEAIYANINRRYIEKLYVNGKKTAWYRHKGKLKSLNVTKYIPLDISNRLKGDARESTFILIGGRWYNNDSIKVPTNIEQCLQNVSLALEGIINNREN